MPVLRDKMQRLRLILHHRPLLPGTITAITLQVIVAMLFFGMQTISPDAYYHYIQFSSDGAYLIVSAWNLPQSELKVWP